MSCYLLNFHTLLPTNKGSETEMLTPHKRKETKNVIRIGCLEQMTVTVTGSWRWEENVIFFPKHKLPRAALSCEIREEPLPFISVRPPCLFPPSPGCTVPTLAAGGTLHYGMPIHSLPGQFALSGPSRQLVALCR